MKIIPNTAFFENIELMLSEGKSVELRCFGSSMQPYLRGDGREVIVASPFSLEELIPGTIVLFRYHGKHICHRIVRCNRENLLMQGDGVINKQEQVPVSDVIGIIRTIVRRNKKPVSTQSKAGRLYWKCWQRLSSVRRYLLFIYRIWLKLITLSS